MDEYEYADRMTRYLLRRLIGVYGRAKSLMPFDELNVLGYSRDMYREIYGLVRRNMRLLAVHYYAEHAGVSARQAARRITDDWVEDYLMGYDPVTGYVFRNEIERRGMRFAENVIAARIGVTGGTGRGGTDRPERPGEPGKPKEPGKRPGGRDPIEDGLKGVAGPVKQAAIGITDEAVRQAYRDKGIERVMWVAVNDGRRCHECSERNGKIYDIRLVPPKPHPNCRCWLVPA